MGKANLAVYQKSFEALFQATLNYLCNSCGDDRISPSPFEDCEDCDEIDYGKKKQPHITNFFLTKTGLIHAIQISLKCSLLMKYFTLKIAFKICLK